MSGDRFEHDVFVGYAGPDRAVARALHAELLDRGIDAFLDETLAPGEVWPQALLRAVRGSRVFAWVISDRTGTGWYDKDEAIEAIALARRDETRRMVPVVLGGAELPYGMRPLQPIRLSDPPTAAEVAEAATALAGLVAPTDDAAPPSPSAVVDPPPIPPLPETPYPLLEPYRHPQLFAGRDAERDRLLDALRRPDGPAVILLRAPTGVGKSSLLRAGVVPGLRGQLGDGAAPVPVALTDHPDAPGVARELLGQLISTPALDIEDWTSVARAFDGLASPAPVCVLDQFEAVFQAEGEHALARVGQLIAATVLDGRKTRARWVLAYRDDFHGRVLDWASDVLRSVRRLGWTVDGLRHDLRRARRPLDESLPLFGSAPAGASPEDELAAARSAFRDAIVRPWQIEGATWPFTVEPSCADALATALAELRVGPRGRAEPLVPTLQVVLSRLIALAREQGASALSLDLLPDDDRDDADRARAAVQDALARHLRRAVASVCATFRSDDREVAEQRVLLALRRLVGAGGPLDIDADGRTRPTRTSGARAEALGALIGTNGAAILAALSGHDHRLLVIERADDLDDDSRLFRLSHDLIAEAISAEADRRRDRLHEGAPLRVEALVASRAWLHAREDPGAVELTPGQYRAVEKLADGLLDSPDRIAWWGDARARAISRRRRRWGRGALSVAGTIGLVALVWWLWALADNYRSHARVLVTLSLLQEDEPWDRYLTLLDRGYDLIPLVRSWRGLDAAPPSVINHLLEGPDAVEDPRECSLRAALITYRAEAATYPSGYGTWLRFAAELSVGICAPTGQRTWQQLGEQMRQRYGPPPPELITALDFVRSPHEDEESVRCPSAFDHGATVVLTTGPFEVSRSEIAYDQFGELIRAAGLTWSARDRSARMWPDMPGGTARLPVDVHWSDAAAFAAWVGGRLPSAAEWSCAAWGDRDPAAAPPTWRWSLRWSGTEGAVLEGEPTAGDAPDWGLRGLLSGPPEWLMVESKLLHGTPVPDHFNRVFAWFAPAVHGQPEGRPEIEFRRGRLAVDRGTFRVARDPLP